MAILILIILAVFLSRNQNQEDTQFITIGLFLSIALLLWIGNVQITRFFDHQFPWLSYGRRRFFFHLVAGILYTLFVINGSYQLFKVLFTSGPPTTEQVIVANVYGLVLFIPTFSIYFSLQFLRHWQETQMEAERFQKESIRSELNSLKNHLDPHFLFNNLNILSSLIDKDPAASQNFLERFASFYRKILHTKSEELITVEEELDFVATYMYLINTRFENNITYQLQISSEAKSRMIPPLTLQMLIENAIKHNLITETKPLHIEICDREDDYVQVSNTICEKPESLREKSGSGLDNIQSRFKYFTTDPVLIERNEDRFIVNVPLLTIEII